MRHFGVLRPFNVGDWAQIRLVVFDLDGTLYEQRPVRLAMAKELAFEALRMRSLCAVRALSKYRTLREDYAESGKANFEAELIAEVAQAYRLPVTHVADLVKNWIQIRPLRYLARARVPGIVDLFAMLRASGRIVAVWSDYPVPKKLGALGLEADITVSATEPGIGRLKPDPAGLLRLCTQTGISPCETLLIGDRMERDGEAARRAGCYFLLRCRSGAGKFPSSFVNYKDELFQPKAVGCEQIN